ncbi:OmpP1/FadL family transporter [Thiomicrorhabdus indica]|uniref:OmpP1/FadL family transporter n=1 Tax=Thiomicrorhabdus indica TaxID=2267253 RepID=UPI00102D7B9F|nr:outer membrane protein transport protein [Thiomicrorhabdus indica]
MKKTKLAIAIAAASLISAPAYATNGMNMAGYGPISTGMGGTAQAFNNGLGGMMNNPATMGMGAKEGNKFQIGLGQLGPDVNSKMSAAMIDQDSAGDSYFMPGFGYARKKDGITWGIGILGQGGMGTEYGKADTTGMSGDLFARGYSMMTNPQTDPMNTVALSGEENRSELSVGRVLLPVNVEVNDKLTVGGSIDFVWAGMDIMMDVSGNQFGALAEGGNVSGTMFSGLNQMMANRVVSDVNWARFDFSDNSDYTGEAKGTGLGGKLGMTYKFNDKLSFGASYHSKTNLSDMKGDATLSMNVNADTGVMMGGMPNGQYADMTIPVSGEIKLKDFQWPETFGMGFAFTPNEKWLVTADYKRINWSDVMADFNMVFTADNVATNGNFAGASIDVTLPQDWEDQNVFMLGTAYQMNKQLTLRAGMNLSSNPIPDDKVNPLFPAITEKHYMLGFGYNFDKQHSIDGSITHAPEVTVTGSGALNNGVEISHAQTNWQLLYTYKWGIKK